MTLATSELSVYPQLLVAEPNWLGRRCGVRRVEYAWPVAVVQRNVLSCRFVFPGKPALLVEINGMLGSIIVPARHRYDLHLALRAAGFTVVEVIQYGWVGPNEVPTDKLAGHDRDVPECVVRRQRT